MLSERGLQKIKDLQAKLRQLAALPVEEVKVEANQEKDKATKVTANLQKGKLVKLAAALKTHGRAADPFVPIIASVIEALELIVSNNDIGIDISAFKELGVELRGLISPINFLPRDDMRTKQFYDLIRNALKDFNSEEDLTTKGRLGVGIVHKIPGTPKTLADSKNILCTNIIRQQHFVWDEKTPQDEFDCLLKEMTDEFNRLYLADTNESAVAQLKPNWQAEYKLLVQKWLLKIAELPYIIFYIKEDQEGKNQAHFALPRVHFIERLQKFEIYFNELAINQNKELEHTFALDVIHHCTERFNPEQHQEFVDALNDLLFLDTAAYSAYIGGGKFGLSGDKNKKTILRELLTEIKSIMPDESKSDKPEVKAGAKQPRTSTYTRLTQLLHATLKCDAKHLELITKNKKGPGEVGGLLARTATGLYELSSRLDECSDGELHHATTKRYQPLHLLVLEGIFKQARQSGLLPPSVMDIVKSYHGVAEQDVLTTFRKAK